MHPAQRAEAILRGMHEIDGPSPVARKGIVSGGPVGPHHEPGTAGAFRSGPNAGERAYAVVAPAPAATGFGRKMKYSPAPPVPLRVVSRTMVTALPSCSPQ